MKTNQSTSFTIIQALKKISGYYDRCNNKFYNFDKIKEILLNIQITETDSSKFECKN